MKGLLLKDYYMILKNFRVYLLMSAFFLVFSVWNNNGLFMLFYPALFSGMIPISIITFDEKSGWDRYCLCFPLSRSQVVVCKYLITLLCTAGIILFYALVWGIKFLVTGTIGDLSFYIPFLISISLLPPALLLPCVLKFGSQKGSMMYYLVIAVFLGIIMGLANFFNLNSYEFARFNHSISLLLPLISAAVFALSWPLSARIMEKKDF